MSDPYVLKNGVFILKGGKAGSGVPLESHVIPHGNSSVGAKLDELNQNLTYKIALNKSLDSLVTSAKPNTNNMYHGINVLGLPQEYGFTDDNDVWVNIIKYDGYETAKVTLYDVRSDGIYTISKLNGDYGYWHSLIPAPHTFVGTLGAGYNRLYFNSSMIKTDSIIKVSTSQYGINPSSVTKTNGRIELAFNTLSYDLKVAVEVINSDIAWVIK